ncbi:MAG: hypothetical protein M9955_13395 [Rhizobiaceae bacterium]|nr:hypothetical protein [Rhizobiaceae bacterium]
MVWIALSVLLFIVGVLMLLAGIVMGVMGILAAASHPTGGNAEISSWLRGARLLIVLGGLSLVVFFNLPASAGAHDAPAGWHIRSLLA